MQIEAILSPEQAKWEQRRYELAKETMVAIINSVSIFDYDAEYIRHPGIKETARVSAEYADALIRALRNEPQDSDE